MDPTLDAIKQRIHAAASDHRPLCIRGGGTKDWYGERHEGDVLDVSAHAGIVDYEPSELVLTAKAGTPLTEIERLLAEQQQMLAFEPPHFARGEGAHTTFGGCIAAGLSGPRRISAGALRDFMLGVQMLNGRAELLRFGGRVMKNVAGYDISRVLAGSLGELGVIVEASIKVLPRPAMEATLRFEMDAAQAMTQLNTWAGQAWPISASAWHDGVVSVRLSGAAAAVQSGLRGLGGERLENSASDVWWLALREQTLPFFQSDQPLWRIAVPSTTALLTLPGTTLLEWHGGLRWIATDAPADTVRAQALAAGGHATRWRLHDRQREPGATFTPLSAPLLAIHRRLKAEFDPAGIFNPGRLFGV